MSRVQSLKRPVLSWEFVDEKTGEVKRKASRTKQADKDACDINNILRRYEKTGQLPEMIRNDGQFGDFSSVPDFMEACEIVAKAQEQFNALSAAVRLKFNHDPAQMLAFCSDPKNEKEMIELGLALPKEEETKTIVSEKTQTTREESPPK